MLFFIFFGNLDRGLQELIHHAGQTVRRKLFSGIVIAYHRGIVCSARRRNLCLDIVPSGLQLDEVLVGSQLGRAFDLGSDSRTA
jgi:hypothetical protein